MAAFPTLTYGHTLASTWELIDDRDTERADDGTAYGRAYFAAPKRRFMLDFTLQEQADLDAVLAHYTAHRTSPGFDFLWRDGATYTCIYPKDAIRSGGLEKPTRYKFKVVLEEA